MQGQRLFSRVLRIVRKAEIEDPDKDAPALYGNCLFHMEPGRWL